MKFFIQKLHILSFPGEDQFFFFLTHFVKASVKKRKLELVGLTLDFISCSMLCIQVLISFLIPETFGEFHYSLSMTVYLSRTIFRTVELSCHISTMQEVDAHFWCPVESSSVAMMVSYIIHIVSRINSSFCMTWMCGH